jgi:hypothetical protein
MLCIYVIRERCLETSLHSKLLKMGQFSYKITFILSVLAHKINATLDIPL